ncbi:MAG: hypothetical protein KDD44_10290 [Bdellovibrionales bacterium]|nr:hypothetical protein [Bdellovibrionales bacterium]
MDRRTFLKLTSLSSLPALTGCAYARIDPWHYMVRSDLIDSPEAEAKIRSKARVGWTADRRVRVLFTSGTPYERGYQHGALLREEVQDNLGHLYDTARKKFHFEELFAESYERIRPYIPAEYVEEMHGLAHGARIPLHVVHHLHALPTIAEWGGKKRVKEVIKKMMAGVDLGTSCSNFSLAGDTTADGEFYVVRILDWGLHKISKLHQYPLIHVAVPDRGIPSANIGWVGFLGAVSGMNAQGITLGEMGYRDPENETMRGKPMIFLLRDVLTYASDLSEVRALVGSAIGTNSFAFVMSDGKTREAQLMIKDRDRFLVADPGKELEDTTAGKTDHLPAIRDVAYGGAYLDIMSEMLTKERGRITVEKLQQEIIPAFAMKSNFQNVIYAPSRLQFWVSNAASKREWAVSQPYSFFDFGSALRKFQNTSS